MFGRSKLPMASVHFRRSKFAQWKKRQPIQHLCSRAWHQSICILLVQFTEPGKDLRPLSLERGWSCRSFQSRLHFRSSCGSYSTACAGLAGGGGRWQGRGSVLSTSAGCASLCYSSLRLCDFSGLRAETNSFRCSFSNICSGLGRFGKLRECRCVSVERPQEFA